MTVEKHELADEPAGKGDLRPKDDKQAAITLADVATFFSHLIIILLLCLAAYLVTGFLRFAVHVTNIQGDNPVLYRPAADGIVVLTGGRDRIRYGLQLLEEGKGKRLLISGVHPKTSIAAIQHTAKKNEQLFKCCIDLDRAAMDTIGNAEQAANWARQHHFNSMIVVTSTYHMPRSLLEMRRIMPDMDIRPFRVVYEPLNARKWISDPQAMKMIMAEYVKYLAASIKNRFSKSEGQLVLSKMNE